MISNRCVDLLVGQGRGRLVHDQDVGIVGDRLRDLDHLLVGDRQRAELALGIEIDADAVEQRLRVCRISSP